MPLHKLITQLIVPFLSFASYSTEHVIGWSQEYQVFLDYLNLAYISNTYTYKTFCFSVA